MHSRVREADQWAKYKLCMQEVQAKALAMHGSQAKNQEWSLSIIRYSPKKKKKHVLAQDFCFSAKEVIQICKLVTNRPFKCIVYIVYHIYILHIYNFIYMYILHIYTIRANMCGQHLLYMHKLRFLCHK